MTDASLQIVFEKALKALLLYFKMRITGLIYVVIIFNDMILFKFANLSLAGGFAILEKRMGRYQEKKKNGFFEGDLQAACFLSCQL